MSDSTHGVRTVSLKTSIGWIGTGVMGISMCRHLMERGFVTTVFNRTREKALPLIEKGAFWVILLGKLQKSRMSSYHGWVS